MPTSFDSDSIAIARLNTRVEAMGTRIVAMEEKQSSDMLQLFSAIEKLARSIDNLKSSVQKIPNPHDQPIRQHLTPLVPTTSTENEEVISAEFGSNHQRVSLETVGKWQGVMKSEIIFCDLNGLEHSCPLAVCENDLVDFTSDFVTKMAFVGSWCPTHPFKIVTRCMKPPPKPPDVIKLDETLELKLSFCASYLFLNLCSPSVCKSALMVWPSHSSIQMDSVGGFNCISHPKIETTFVKPPAKPPDDFFICAPLDVKVRIEIATSYTNVHPKFCDMIFECLSFNMCEFDLKNSGGGSGLEDNNEPVCLNMVLYKGNEKEFAVKKIFLMILMKMKVIAKPPDKSPLLSISHKSKHLNIWISSLQTKVLSVDFSSLFTSLKPTVVEKAIELEFGVPFSIFTGYLHLCISYVCEDALQTFFPSSDVRWTSITSHNISCRSNDIVQSIWSWVGKPFWLPTDDTGYFILWHGWLTKVGNFVLECLDMADFTLLLKHDELKPSDFAHKIKGRQRTPCLRALSGFEVFLIVLDPVTRRLNLNPIYKHVMVHVMWFAGTYEEKLYIQVVIALCPGALLNRMTAKNIYSEHVVAAIYGVILNMLHFCRHLVVKHTDIEMENYLVSNMVEDILLEAIDFGEPLFIEDVLTVGGCVGYFEVDSTKLDQPMNKVWPATVRFKGSTKFSFYKDSTKPYDIIIIEETTEGTSSSTFSFSLKFINVYQLMLAWYLRFLKFYVLLWIEENVQWLNVWWLLDLAWYSPIRLKTETYVLGDLEDVRLVSLNMGSLAATAKYRGHFEDILRAMLNEVEEIDDKMILFIYEIQLILSARRRSVILLMERLPDLVLGEDLLDEENINNLAEKGHSTSDLFLSWDGNNHGKHKTSTITNRFQKISYNTLAEGKVRRGAPTIHIAAPVIDWDYDYYVLDILLLIAKAIKDVANVLSASQYSTAHVKYLATAISFGSFHARSHGLMLLCVRDRYPYGNSTNYSSSIQLFNGHEEEDEDSGFDSATGVSQFFFKSQIVAQFSNRVGLDIDDANEQRGPHLMMEFIEALITNNQTKVRIESHNKVIFKRNFAWNLLTSIFTWRCEFLLFSLPRPPEVDDLEDKVDFKGRGMMRINNVGLGPVKVFVMTKAHTLVKSLLV